MVGRQGLWGGGLLSSGAVLPPTCPTYPVSVSRAHMWAVNCLPSPCCEWIQTPYPCPMSSEWENLKTPQRKKKIHMEKTP